MPFFALLIYFFKKITHSQYDINKKEIVYLKDFNFAFIVTAHRDVSLLPPLVDSLLKQSYKNFTVYIVADACNTNELEFSDQRIKLLRPQEALNSKILSIKYALDHFTSLHDALIIVDPDNLLHPRFLEVINQYFQKGFKGVQANLQPKNQDSIFAKLDSMGDQFYNFIDREMRMEVGFSSAIWGSGIAIETDLYQEIIYSNKLGGFDKKIQTHIVQRTPQLAYAKEALIYDEKISNGSSLQLQRTRWIYAYFSYLKLGWQLLIKGIKEFDINLIVFGFFNLRPPFFLLCFAGIVACVLHYWIESWLFISWIIILMVFAFSFVSINLLKSRNKKNIWSVFLMPLFIVRQIAALINIKKAGKSFLKTKHSKLIYIEDLLRNESV